MIHIVLVGDWNRIGTQSIAYVTVHVLVMSETSICFL